MIPFEAEERIRREFEQQDDKIKQLEKTIEELNKEIELYQLAVKKFEEETVKLKVANYILQA